MFLKRAANHPALRNPSMFAEPPRGGTRRIARRVHARYYNRPCTAQANRGCREIAPSWCGINVRTPSALSPSGRHHDALTSNSLLCLEHTMTWRSRQRVSRNARSAFKSQHSACRRTIYVGRKAGRRF